MKPLLLLALTLAGCVEQTSVPSDQVDSFATVPPARKPQFDNKLQCNAEIKVNWFDNTYKTSPLCVLASSTGTCGVAQELALQDRLAKDYVKCPGCDAGEKGCEPRALINIGALEIKGGNCCLKTVTSPSWPPVFQGISEVYREWCTTCVGAECAEQDIDTGVCVDEATEADRTSFPE